MTSCRQGNKNIEENIQDKYLRLLSYIRSETVLRNDVSADSLFNCEYIFPDEGSSFAFVFDGSCSSCVSEAIDFLATMAVSGLSDEMDVKFFSKSEANDIFYYYMNRNLSQSDAIGGLPICYIMIERDEVPNGLYRVDNGNVTNYLPWHY